MPNDALNSKCDKAARWHLAAVQSVSRVAVTVR